jgi:hypothetical protein
MSLTHAFHEFKSFDGLPINAYHELQSITNGNIDMKTTDIKNNDLDNNMSDFIDYRHFDQVARSLRANRFAELSLHRFIEKFFSGLTRYAMSLTKITPTAIGNPDRSNCEQSPAGCL